jgi:hypothetical protein
VGPQKDNSIIIEDYVHNHVLRGSLTGTFGEPVKSEGANAGEAVQKTFEYKIPDEFRANKLRFIAFVQDKGTNEIKQAVAKYLDDESKQ